VIRLQQGQRSPVSDILGEALVCPLDHNDLVVVEQTLVCTKCGQVYQIIDGVPNMLVEDE
jgi:uncharacterized protein YbaR (Trm112 family)